MAKSDENNEVKYALPTRYKVIMCILVLIIAGLAAALIVVSVNKSEDSLIVVSVNKSEDSWTTCPQRSTLKPKYTTSQDLYRDLSEAELLQVRDYILNVASLNITPFEKATVNSNYIFLIELQNPIKDDAIAYLDRNGPKPTRVANVIIFKGAVSPPVVEEILVYFDKPMRHEPNTLLTDRTIPLHARPFNKRVEAIQGKIIDDFGMKTHKILNELFGGYVITNCTNRCLTYGSRGPSVMLNSNELISYIWFLRDEPGFAVQPVGLELLIQGEGNDGSKWKTRVRTKDYSSYIIFSTFKFSTFNI